MRSSLRHERWREPARSAPLPRQRALATADGRALAGLPAAHRPIQAKLRVGAVDDPAEHEADRIADALVGGTCPACGGSGGGCATCAASAEALPVQAKAAGGPAPSTAADGVGAGLGAGQPLPAGLAARFGAGLGHDLSAVRVHTGPQAEAQAESLRALAFTSGRDVVFGAGQYQPGTAAGQRLLAHELVHVAQQDHGVVRRKVTEKKPCSLHAYDASKADDNAVVPSDGSGIAVTSVADMVSKVNAHVDDPANGCSCVARLEINGHGTDGYQSVGNGAYDIDNDKALRYTSTDDHLKQLASIKFCSTGLFMMLGCHTGRGSTAGKVLQSRISALLPGKLIGGSQHFTSGTGLGGKRVARAGDAPASAGEKRDPFLESRYVRWHITIGGKEYVINDAETDSEAGKAKLKAADKIIVKTPDGEKIIKK